MSGLTCRGSYFFGTACGKCARCENERAGLPWDMRPAPATITISTAAALPSMDDMLGAIKELARPLSEVPVAILASAEAMTAILAAFPPRPFDDASAMWGVPLREDVRAPRGMYGIEYADGHIDWHPRPAGSPP